MFRRGPRKAGGKKKGGGVVAKGKKGKGSNPKERY